MTRRSRRLLLLTAAVLVLAAAGYSTWLALRVRTELVAAQDAVTRLQQHLTDDDTSARDRAAADLADAATSARDLTDGPVVVRA